MLDTLHRRFVYDRRTAVLARHLSEVIPRDATVLDIGAGDGLVERRLLELRPDLKIQGIDIVLRTEAHAEVSAGDGARLAFADGAVDVALLIDVLHHTVDQAALLREAARVAKRLVVIKDHIADSRLSRVTLSVMDWVGNARYGVPLPYAYLSSAGWAALYQTVGLKESESERRDHLGLYPWPASLLFERGLHFLSALPTTPAPR